MEYRRFLKWGKGKGFKGGRNKKIRKRGGGVYFFQKYIFLQGK